MLNSKPSRVVIAATFFFVTLESLQARALMVNVRGSDYNISFIQGCFTLNYLPSNPPFYPGCGDDPDPTSGIIYTTPDLYSGGSGILTKQPWWGDSALTYDFTFAYRNAALLITGGANDRCEYSPNLGGASCDDSPYFAYAEAISTGYPYYLGMQYNLYNDPNSDLLRQSGFFAVVESASESVPAPLPLAGALPLGAALRKLRKHSLLLARQRS